MKATITKSGQVVIPLILRKKLKLQPGELLEFDERAPFVNLEKTLEPQKNA